MSDEKFINHISRQYHAGMDDSSMVNLGRKQTIFGADAWLLTLIISLLFNLGGGLMLIWMSIDRTDIGYEIHKIQKVLDNGMGHVVKLEVERDSLLSPYELNKKAIELGLKVPTPGQVRRILNFETIKPQDSQP